MYKGGGKGPAELETYLTNAFRAVAGQAAAQAGHSAQDGVEPFDYRSATLVATLVSASGLTDKDNIGLSDPYAVLEVVPVSDTGVKRIKDRKHKDVATAQVSKVIENNLNPVWNQGFAFPHPGHRQGKLVLAVWDFDEKTVQGTKLGKLMGSHEKDAFLGWCEIPLEGASLNGTVITASMEKRSSKSHVSGTVTVNLKLAPGERPQRAISAGEAHHKVEAAVQQYCELIKTFKMYEVGSETKDRWDSDLSPAALEVLKQFAFRKGLSPVLLTAAEWCAWVEANRCSKAIFNFATVSETMQEMLTLVAAGSKADQMAVAGLILATVDVVVDKAIDFVANIINRPEPVHHADNYSEACVLLKYVCENKHLWTAWEEVAAGGVAAGSIADEATPIKDKLVEGLQRGFDETITTLIRSAQDKGQKLESGQKAVIECVWMVRLFQAEVGDVFKTASNPPPTPLHRRVL